MKEELKIVAASGHHLLEKASISTKDLESETLLLTELGLQLQQLVKKENHSLRSYKRVQKFQ